MTDAETEPLRPRAAGVIGVGDVIGAKYRLVRRIGEGGMGVVYEAHHLQLNERVALKMLLGTLESCDELTVRFVREARATAKIRNEHVVSIFDVGEMPGGAPYIVMECLEGQDLANYSAGRQMRPAHEIVDYVLQACEALAEAHVKGIVHRDLKPSNLFLTTRSDGSPCIKVLDFGIAKLTETDDGLTGTNVSMGTVRYMSPEQLRSSRDVDARTDIWSLGVVLFELLTHEQPFRAERGGSLVLSIVGDPPRPLAGLRSDLPQGLADVILRCLEKDRFHRFESVSELAIALAPFGTDDARLSCDRIVRIAGLPSRTVVSATIALPASPPPPNTAPGWGVSARRGTEARYGVIALVAGVCATILTGTIVAGLRTPTERNTSMSSSSEVTSMPAVPVVAMPPASAGSATSIPETLDPSPTAAPSAASVAPSAAPAAVPVTSGTPASRVPSVPPPRPPRTPPKPKPIGTVSDGRHG